MTQTEKASQFRSLHIKGSPLVLYNIWDAGGAKTLDQAGATAIATGSWSMAAAHGYADGEAIPLSLVLTIVERIATSVALPLTVDFESGYATQPDRITENVRKVIKAGAIGINFEDQIMQGEGLYKISIQVERLRAVRHAAELEGIPLFINARTDLFLGAAPSTHDTLIAAAIDRAVAYADAGADGFFIPGLIDPTLIKQIVDSVSLPVNVMMAGELSSVSKVAGLGVSRASYGPTPYFNAMSNMSDQYKSLK